MVIHQSKKTNISKAKLAVTQRNNVKYIIKQSQTFMLALKDNLHYKPFNNTVEPHDCVDRLVAHRITSKFHIDSGAASKVLQQEAFSKYIDYDSQLSEVNLWDSLDLRKARLLLHKWFRSFSVDVASINYEVTPGETYISSGGEVSISSKLYHRDHWTTTANCLEDTCVFIYNNLSFKRAANYHIGRVTRKERRKLYLRFKHKPDVGYHVFKYLLIDRVLILVDGARGSTVPKSNDERRFINVEAMFPVILQRAGAQEFLRVLKRQGNDLGNFKVKIVADPTGFRDYERSAQSLHGLLIKDSRFSTIDFKKASDSVTVDAVCSLFPEQVSSYLIRNRSHYVMIDGHLHQPKKLSSMGNGFTFEVMTAMLYAIASVMTPFARVYGDDVIIPNEHVHRFVSACELVDFRVNYDKTFINSFFRESCGYFYSDHINDYITSFDFGQISSLSDVIVTCNKLTVIIEAGQVSPDLSDKLVRTRDSIAALVHASRKGPVPEPHYQRKFLALYIYDSGFVKKQRRSRDLMSLRQHYIEKNGSYFDACQIDRSDVSLMYLPFFVPHRSRHLFANTKGMDVYSVFLYSLRRSNPVQKGKGKWVDLPAFVSSDGTVTLISNLIRSYSVWTNRLEGVLLAHERK